MKRSTEKQGVVASQPIAEPETRAFEATYGGDPP
jgi:hypothetical protein